MASSDGGCDGGWVRGGHGVRCGLISVPGVIFMDESLTCRQRDLVSSHSASSAHGRWQRTNERTGATTTTDTCWLQRPAASAPHWCPAPFRLPSAGQQRPLSSLNQAGSKDSESKVDPANPRPNLGAMGRFGLFGQPDQMPPMGQRGPMGQMGQMGPMGQIPLRDGSASGLNGPMMFPAGQMSQAETKPSMGQFSPIGQMPSRGQFPSLEQLSQNGQLPSMGRLPQMPPMGHPQSKDQTSPFATTAAPEEAGSASGTEAAKDSSANDPSSAFQSFMSRKNTGFVPSQFDSSSTEGVPPFAHPQSRLGGSSSVGMTAEGPQTGIPPQLQMLLAQAQMQGIPPQILLQQLQMQRMAAQMQPTSQMSGQMTDMPSTQQIPSQNPLTSGMMSPSLPGQMQGMPPAMQGPGQNPMMSGMPPAMQVPGQNPFMPGMPPAMQVPGQNPF
ncbi:hypothetical protein C0Q70_08252 [Pomacea canaliculata]|uniref:Uncharacterized protein n=1 Tax=Pomacea canaliculata TaxID=400727 RepID=A0A2T7PHA5_POMCA|nr:hypothetical protein C0Q70_08252 [Pomacea canaliculata]